MDETSGQLSTKPRFVGKLEKCLCEFKAAFVIGLEDNEDCVDVAWISSSGLVTGKMFSIRINWFASHVPADFSRRGK